MKEAMLISNQAARSALGSAEGSQTRTVTSTMNNRSHERPGEGEANPADVGWLAGIIDGEECLALLRNVKGRGFQPRLEIASSSPEILGKCSHILRQLGATSLSVYEVKPGGLRKKLSWRLYTSKRHELVLVLRSILQHLTLKREAALAILSFYKGRSNNKGWSSEEVAQVEAIKHKHMPKSLSPSHDVVGYSLETRRVEDKELPRNETVPIIRAVAPSLIADEIVSVQPMQGPTSLVFYLDYRAGQTKGSITQGDVLFSATTGRTETTDYTSELIDSEQVGSGDGGTTVFTFSLNYRPVKPGTVIITCGNVVVRDDGNGNLVGTGVTAGTINYIWGWISGLTFGAAPSAGEHLIVQYKFDSEGSLLTPTLDISIVGQPIIAEPRKLRARWSTEAMFDLRNLHGIEADTAITEKMAELIRAEIDLAIINDLTLRAGAGSVAWSMNTPAGVSWAEHKLSIVDKFIEASNLVFRATGGRAHPNFIVAGTTVASVIESHPRFIGTIDANVGTTGPVKIGRLQDRWDVYKNPFGATRQFLVGYKGNSFLDAGCENAQLKSRELEARLYQMPCRES